MPRPSRPMPLVANCQDNADSEDENLGVYFYIVPGLATTSSYRTRCDSTGSLASRAQRPPNMLRGLDGSLKSIWGSKHICSCLVIDHIYELEDKEETLGLFAVA